MKKFISMALALVMTLSLCTFVAVPEANAAADFTDTDELSQYAQQAIDVIEAIDVMAGYEDDTFKPEATLTRQAAAKIICNMILGPVTAKALPTNEAPFPDVKAGTEWAGYISYCSHEKIINGYSDGTFKPTGALTGYAFLKMLLGALGYSGAAEGFTGGNWKVNVAKIALGIGLNKGVTSDPDGEKLDQGVTRQDAAIYAFNTLQGDMVEYPSQNTISINGVAVSMGSGKATPQTWNTSSTQANHINLETDNGRDIVQFAERYFDKLERFPKVWDAYNPDDLGRPSIRWTWKGVKIGTYPETAALTYSGNVAANTIYADLGMSTADDFADTYFNGRAAGTVKVAKSNGDDINENNAIMKDKIGDGDIVEVYYNDANNEVTICVMNVWAGKVTGFKDATSTKKARLVLEPGLYDSTNADDAHPICAPLGINAAGKAERCEYEPDKEAELDNYEEDDIVAFIYDEDDNSIKEILGTLSPVEGALTRRYQGKSVVLDGDTYKYAKNVVFSTPTNKETDLANKSSYVVYVDEDGLVLWIEEAEFSVDQYALVDRIWIENSNGSNVISQILVNGAAGAPNPNESASTAAPRARLILSNGAKRDVTLNESKAYRTDGATPATDTIATDFQAGKIVRFSVNADGEYKLQTIKTGSFASYNDTTVTDTATIKDNTGNKIAVKYALYKNSLLGFGAIQADANTRFVVNDGGTYKTYTGIRNAPDLYGMLDTAGNPVEPVGYAYCKGSLAKIVYFTLCNLSTTSKDITFLAAPSVSKLVTEDDPIPYYEYNAVVKNEITTVRVAAYANGKSSGSNLVLTWGENNYAVTTGSNKKLNCVLLNTTEYNTDDVLTSGSFDTAKGVQAYKANAGIKRVSGSTEDIKLYTKTEIGGVLSGDRTEINKTFAENARVFYSNLDGEIEEIDIEDIRTDSNDIIYYTQDEGDITYMFIQELDEEQTPDAPAAPAKQWKDGELEDVNGDGMKYVLHYLKSGSTIKDTTAPAIQAYLVSQTAWTNLSISSSANGVYTFTSSQSDNPITVTLKTDAELDVNGNPVTQSTNN